MGNEERGPGKPGMVVFPDGADVMVNLPGLAMPPGASPAMALIFPAVFGNKSKSGEMFCRIEEFIGTDDKKSAHKEKPA
jgi:hypothetical protein